MTWTEQERAAFIAEQRALVAQQQAAPRTSGGDTSPAARTAFLVGERARTAQERLLKPPARTGSTIADQAAADRHVLQVEAICEEVHRELSDFRATVSDADRALQRPNAVEEQRRMVEMDHLWAAREEAIRHRAWADAGFPVAGYNPQTGRSDYVPSFPEHGEPSGFSAAAVIDGTYRPPGQRGGFSAAARIERMHSRDATGSFSPAE